MRRRVVQSFHSVSKSPTLPFVPPSHSRCPSRVCDNGHVCPTGQYYCAGQCYNPSSQCCSNGALASSSGSCLCNGQGFGGATYACDNNQLCPKGNYACGGACFVPSCEFSWSILSDKKLIGLPLISLRMLQRRFDRCRTRMLMDGKRKRILGTIGITYRGPVL